VVVVEAGANLVARSAPAITTTDAPAALATGGFAEAGCTVVEARLRAEATSSAAAADPEAVK
jgi:hypothetical protein